MGTAIGAIAFQAQRNSGYPAGGSLAFAQAVEQRFCSLGGQIFYGSQVEKILTEPVGRGEKSRAVGLRLRGGREFHADWVISAADGRNTAYNLVEGRFLDQEMKTRYTSLPLTPPALQISLGIRREMRDAPHSLVDMLPQPVYFAGEEHTHFWYHVMNFDPSAAPRGKTVIISRLRSSYDHWRKLAEERSRYETEKLAVADALIRHLEGRWPGISESFALTPQTARYCATGFPSELPRLERFYQIGSWLQPGGGIFPSARSGRVAVQRMCRTDGRRFITTALKKDRG
jgi:phytoene dehydrogenase-like protein